MKDIKKTSSIVIIFIYVIKSLCKDVISISLENSKKGIEKNHIIQIEIRDGKNNSRGNIISGSSEETKKKMETESQNESNSYENGEKRPTGTECADNHRSVPNFEPRGCTKKSTRKSIASNDSTIETSDQKYQAHIISEESSGEENDAFDDYPYTVSIQRKGAHYASVALVGKRWVLSTAEEFYNVRETLKLFRVRLGSTNCKKGGFLSPIKSVTIHPDFTPGQPASDISVLEMADQIPMSGNIRPIGISRVKGKVIGGQFLTTYWPRIVLKQGVLPPTAKERVQHNIMRVSTQTLVPSEECGDQLAAVNVTLGSSMCLQPVALHHSVCMPDAGAPVVATDGLWGITSGWVSPTCPLSPLPTVFTRVTSSAFRTWIYGQMVD